MPLYTIKLSRNKSSVGSLGPYATRRAAAIDALTLVLNSGVPRSSVTELGKKDRRSKGVRSIDGGPSKRFAVGYKYQPSGYVGAKPDGTDVEARIVANKKGEMPKANPRYKRKRPAKKATRSRSRRH